MCLCVGQLSSTKLVTATHQRLSARKQRLGRAFERSSDSLAVRRLSRAGSHAHSSRPSTWLAVCASVCVCVCLRLPNGLGRRETGQSSRRLIRRRNARSHLRLSSEDLAEMRARICSQVCGSTGLQLAHCTCTVSLLHCWPCPCVRPNLNPNPNPNPNPKARLEATQHNRFNALPRLALP